MFVLTYFLSQLRKMLILLIRCHCKICPLPTIRSRVFVLFATGTNEQNQHFAVLRQKVSLYIHAAVLQSGLRNLDGKLERFVTKKMEKAIAKLESDRL